MKSSYNKNSLNAKSNNLLGVNTWSSVVAAVVACAHLCHVTPTKLTKEIGYSIAY